MNAKGKTMILAEKKTSVGGTMLIIMDIDDGIVEFATFYQGVRVDFGQSQAEAWAWYNTTA